MGESGQRDHYEERRTDRYSDTDRTLRPARHALRTSARYHAVSAAVRGTGAVPAWKTKTNAKLKALAIFLQASA